MATMGVTSQLGRDQFMQLLVTQMRNQNPLEPIKDAEFIAQLAQFSSLEGIENLNATFGDMLALQQVTQASDLIGKTVVYQPGDSSTITRGTVDGITVRDGAVNLIVNQTLVPLDQVRGLVASQS